MAPKQHPMAAALSSVGSSNSYNSSPDLECSSSAVRSSRARTNSLRVASEISDVVSSSSNFMCGSASDGIVRGSIVRSGICSFQSGSAPRRPVARSHTSSHIERRGWRLEFSIISQIDGILYSLLGLRVERDALATSAEESMCLFFGLPPAVPWSAFTSVFFEDFSEKAIAAMIAHAKEDRVLSVFILPVVQDAPWFKELMLGGYCVVRMKFFIPESCVSVLHSGASQVPPNGLVALVLDFGYVGRVKRKLRPEKVFWLRSIEKLNKPPLTVGTIPTLMTRSSPLANSMAPKAGQDTAPDEGPGSPPAGCCAPTQVESKWNRAVFRDYAEGFPHSVVSSLALQATHEGVNPFRGNLRKRVSRGLAKAMPEELASKFRAKLVEEVLAGRVSGPFADVPYEFYRLCPGFSVKKNPHDPTCDKIRPISNFSSGHASSVNALCWSPRLIGFHPRPMHIRDRIAACGKGALMYAADVPHAFRWLPILKAIRHLFVYKLFTKKFGVEIFVDGCAPFGWSPSEWAWQCVLAILMWAILKHGLAWVLAYVDNFFHIMPPSCVDFDSQCALLDSILLSAGISLHERQRGCKMKGLGWLWDSSTMVMECPEDKFHIMCRLLGEWSKLSTLSLAQLDKACGMMYFIGAGFTIGQAAGGYLIHDRTQARALQKRIGGPPSKTFRTLSRESKAALNLWAEIFPKWDRFCPIIEGFTPTSSWEVLGAVDACTGPKDEKEGGAGGWMIDESLRGQDRGLIGWTHKWSSEEFLSSYALTEPSSGVLEAMGVRIWVERFGLVCSGRRVHLCVDNSATVYALQGMYSKTARMMVEVVAIAKLLCEFSIVLRIRHVNGVRDNIIADHLSHRRVEEACKATTVAFGLPLWLR